jgi:hypothetical protein
MTALGFLFSAVSPSRGQPMDSAFTFQGELRSGSQPSQGRHDFQVLLYAQAVGGHAIDGLKFFDVEVSDGLFSLPLDFTGAPFEAGLRYWIEISVRESGDPGAHTLLMPRQRLTATPYALNALSVRAGSIGAAEIDASAVQRRVAGSCAVGSSIRSIAADGTVTCDSGPGPGFAGREIVTFTATHGGTAGSSTSAMGEARCPAGKRVVGGGVSSDCLPAQVVQSYPVETAATSGWYGIVFKQSSFNCGTTLATMTVYAICATLQP